MCFFLIHKTHNMRRVYLYTHTRLCRMLSRRANIITGSKVHIPPPTTSACTQPHGFQPILIESSEHISQRYCVDCMTFRCAATAGANIQTHADTPFASYVNYLTLVCEDDMWPMRVYHCQHVCQCYLDALTRVRCDSAWQQGGLRDMCTLTQPMSEHAA